MTEEKLRELFIMSKKNDLNEELKYQIERIQNWIIEKNFISILILELKNDNSDIHSNIFNLFEEILNKSPNSSLSLKIQSKEIINLIFKILFQFKFISLFKYSNIYFNTLIKYLLDSDFDENEYDNQEEEEEEEDNKEEGNEESNKDEEKNEKEEGNKNILDLILSSNEKYLNILFNKDEDNETIIIIKSTNGDIKSFGELKLEMIDYFLNIRRKRRKKKKKN